MKKYTETKLDSNESLIEYGYHIDDIALLGFKILKLPLKQSDLPTWFSNCIDKADVCLKYLNYSKEYVCITDIANDYKRENTMYNLLSVGDYIIYDYRFDKVYATNYDSMLNLFKNITGYAYEQLLDTAFESDSNSNDKKVDNDSPAITTEYTITKTVNSGCITQYMYSVGELTLFGFKIMEIPLKEHDLPIWFLNFMDKKEVFMTHDGDTILISGIENEYNRVCERSSTSFEINTYNRLRVGDYIIYDPRFDDVYATNSVGFITLLATISGYSLELDTCSEDASAIDDVDNDNGDPGSITAGVIKTKKDNINPNHYKFGDMEAMPFIDAVTEFGEFQPVESPHVKDAIKYLIRYPRKNGLEDLKKAQWFINHLIEVREKIESSVGNQYGSSIIKLNSNESMRLIELLNAGLDDFDRKKGGQDACR